MVGVVSDYLVQLITKQVDEKGLVVWYDPEQAYESVAVELSLPNTTVALFEGSFFKLREDIDHLLNDNHPPRLVVYVPMDRMETHHALIELDCAGVIMQPKQQPPSCNTRLSVVARNALKPILGDEQVSEIEHQVEAGKLSLDDLNSLADKGKDISTGILTLIFGTANPQEVALDFLHSDRHDNNVVKKAAEQELQHLFQVSFDVELSASQSLASWRKKLGQYILLTDLFASLKQLPSSLASVPIANTKSSIDACVRLTQTWRNSRNMRDSYVTVSKQIEKELALNQLQLPVESLQENETFLCVELALLEYVESELIKAANLALVELAKYRLSSFWSNVIPEIQARWALILSAAEVLIEADRVGRAIKKAPSSVLDLVKSYSDDDEPWCALDTHHRHMESRKYNFEFAGSNDHECLEKLLIRAEQRYTEVGSELAKHFITHYQQAEHPIKGLLQQREVFKKRVKPHLSDGKVAYLWVDALRFEMASELCRVLKEDFTFEIQPAIAMMPTITEIGMAALLPNADESAKVVSVGGGKLGLEIAGKVIKDRKDRIKFLREQAGVSVFDAKLDDLLPKPTKKVRDSIQNAELILITSQEIDELGEQDNISQARLQIDGVLSQLRRGIRLLADLGIKTIVLTADHGHIFADELGEDMKIEAPGGEVKDLHRRVWVGLGGTSELSYLRTSLASLGVDSEFDIATPWTFACFKSKGGGRAYFHGGLSPQELIVPVVVLNSIVKPQLQSTGVQWILTPGTPKLTTRFFSVQISGIQSELSLFGFTPPNVKLELRANKKCVSCPVSASYGFEDATGEVKLKIADHDNKQIEPNTITLMLLEEISQKTVGVYLLDATSGVELAEPLTIDVAISM
ncbi:PglZ domain-containing protein [Synechococcus sp. PCC 6312]|uniref:PglZ domain-containing protein n=1 Tax=Synechococcus sp. (strain ATCC 27167 / PCC 6312) TaxID=195253 RepID=UPI00029EFF44|nr:PglZ domain-containing protein [Synechococcus sp. PCC 6312]AFY60116.1 PglZ domain-containing protein [Synechococcus sp. PCC 6312]